MDDEARRDLRIFVSSLAIGICVGAFAVFFFYALPLERANRAADPAACAAQARQLASCQSSVSELKQMRLPVPPPAPPAAQPPAAMVDIPPPPPKPVPPASQHASEEPAATPVATAPAPLAEPVPPAPAAPLVWPKDWPDRPKVKPAVKAGSSKPVAAAPVPQETAEVAAAPLDIANAPIGSKNVTLDVGEEANLGEGYKLALLGVSRRKNGNFCVVGGNALQGQRIATGTKKRVDWRGHSMMIGVTVKDGNTCQVSVQPG